MNSNHKTENIKKESNTARFSKNNSEIDTYIQLKKIAAAIEKEYEELSASKRLEFEDSREALRL